MSFGIQEQEQTGAAALANMEMFAGLPSDVLQVVAATARIEDLPANHLIFEQGARAARGYAVVDGSIRIVQTGRDGGQLVVRFIRTGDMFGTVPLFTDHRFPADAITVEPTRIMSWSEADLRGLMQRYPAVAMNLVSIIGARLLEAQNRLRELSTQPAEQRVAHTLLRLGVQAGRRVGAGTEISIRLRRKDLAQLAGTTLYTASRILAAWNKNGVIASAKHRLTIRNQAALRRIAEPAGR